MDLSPPPPSPASSVFRAYLRTSNPRLQDSRPIVLPPPPHAGEGVVRSLLPSLLRRRQEAMKEEVMGRVRAPFFRAVVTRLKPLPVQPEKMVTDEGDMLRFRGCGIMGNTPGRATMEFMGKPFATPQYVECSKNNGLGSANIPRSEHEQKTKSVRVAVHKHKVPFFERLGHDAAYLRANRLPEFVIDNPYALLHSSDMRDFSQQTTLYFTNDPENVSHKSPPLRNRPPIPGTTTATAAAAASASAVTEGSDTTTTASSSMDGNNVAAAALSIPVYPPAVCEDVQMFLERKYGLIDPEDDDDYLSPRWTLKKPSAQKRLNRNSSAALYSLWGGEILTPKMQDTTTKMDSFKVNADISPPRAPAGNFTLDSTSSPGTGTTPPVIGLHVTSPKLVDGKKIEEPSSANPVGAIYGLPFPSVTDLGYIHDPDSESLLPWRYLMAIPGKNVRDGLIDAFNLWLKVNPAVLSELKDIVGYLHVASLMVDDIEDGSITRRGIPCAHRVFGVDNVINSANYVYMLALQKTLGLQSPRCVEIYTQEMLNLHRGQGRDIWWRNQERVPTEDEYVDMVVDKTGGLFRMAIRMMGALSPKLKGGEDRVFRLGQSIRETIAECESILPYETLSNLLGAYFQIRDDVLNLASPEFHRSKGFCDDVQEGKLSFPLIHCIETLRAQEMAGYASAAHFRLVLREILNQRSHDVRMKKLALRIICLTSSVEYTVWRLDLMAKRIQDLILEMGGNPPLTKLIDGLQKDLLDCANCLNRVVYVKDHESKT